MCYTRRDNLRCGYGTMINREDLAKIIRIGFESSLLAARPPIGPLTLDLFGDVGLRIRRVSYLYTINALKLHMWLVQLGNASAYSHGGTSLYYDIHTQLKAHAKF